MSAITETNGFVVSDAAGTRIGRVEAPLYGSSHDEPDALAVRSEGLVHRHFLVPATAVYSVDELAGEIELSLERAKLLRFLSRLRLLRRP